MAPARAVTVIAIDQAKWSLVSRFMAVTLMRLKKLNSSGDDATLEGLIDEILDQIVDRAN